MTCLHRDNREVLSDDDYRRQRLAICHAQSDDTFAVCLRKGFV